MNKKCKPNCPTGIQRLPNGKCCPKGQELVNKKCEANCPAGIQRLQNGNCCPNGQELVKKKCVSECPKPLQRGQNGKCCPDGKVLLGNECLPGCPKPLYRLPNGKCGCSKGKALKDGKCVHINCSGNKIFNNVLKKCVCKPGYEEWKEKCFRICKNSEVKRQQNSLNITMDIK